ncbi:MAG: phosphate propanoyltransferase [Oscillospiraceae bacterium]|nr:phosphate propanoyltransferase [Oscillospiraceae bacterium]
MEPLKIMIESSGRHAHLSAADAAVLFGSDYDLDHDVKKELSQPGQFASHQKVTVKGPKGELSMTVLGPCRKESQVEVSLTDARALGLVPQIRESGALDGTDGCVLVGPKGEVALNCGLIVAKRHIHLTPETAERHGIKDKDILKVRVGEERALIFDQVVARVNPTYADAMHIDYDEANAAKLTGTTYGVVLL